MTLVPLGSAGNVDSNGDVVDVAQRERLWGAIDPDAPFGERVELTERLLQVVRRRTAPASSGSWIPGGSG